MEANVAILTLLGQYMADNFSLSADSVGGTQITDPAITSASQNLITTSG